jgi:predicted metal-dependent hydrolase
MRRENASSEQVVLSLAGQDVTCRLCRSKHASRLRIRVTAEAVSVVLPPARSSRDGVDFLRRHERWVVEQLQRARKIISVRRTNIRKPGELLFRGELVGLSIEQRPHWNASARITHQAGGIYIVGDVQDRVRLWKSLENWMRRQARAAIEQEIARLSKLLRRAPNVIYVMGQRTKWGNCSALGNLSFNWRLIMAPEYVLRYVVTHEMVHLAIADHSPKFWLAVQSLCPETERARQWLIRNGERLAGELYAKAF